MSSWVWLVRTHPIDGLGPRTRERGAPLVPSATLSWPDGRREILAACAVGHQPEPTARRADAVLIDPGEPATCAVAQWLEEGREPLFDDPSVQQVLRLLAAWPGGPVSTLTRDTVQYCGAVPVAPASEPGHEAEGRWPLRSLGAATPAKLGRAFLPPGRGLHGTQRSGGAPWPAPSDRIAGGDVTSP